MSECKPNKKIKLSEIERIPPYYRYDGDSPIYYLQMSIEERDALCKAVRTLKKYYCDLASLPNPDYLWDALSPFDWSEDG